MTGRLGDMLGLQVLEGLIISEENQESQKLSNPYYIPARPDVRRHPK